MVVKNEELREIIRIGHEMYEILKQKDKLDENYKYLEIRLRKLIIHIEDDN